MNNRRSLTASIIFFFAMVCGFQLFAQSVQEEIPAIKLIQRADTIQRSEHAHAQIGEIDFKEEMLFNQVSEAILAVQPDQLHSTRSSAIQGSVYIDFSTTSSNVQLYDTSQVAYGIRWEAAVDPNGPFVIVSYAASHTIPETSRMQYYRSVRQTDEGPVYSELLHIPARTTLVGTEVITGNNTYMSGEYTFRGGSYTVPAGSTVNLAPGVPLVVNSPVINIAGTIDGRGDGYSGGGGGSGGGAASASCIGRGGAAGRGGSAGSGPGGGLAGVNGNNGGQSCQSCGGFLCIGNADGCNGGGSGGSSGGGGSYGGTGAYGSYSAAGNDLSQTPGFFGTCNGSGGSWVSGRGAGLPYGTATGTDIAMGSGGSGAGGGGGGWSSGGSGGSGGRGGGSVTLLASSSLTITGSVLVSGNNGGSGGNGSPASTGGPYDNSASSYSCCDICFAFCVWDASGGAGAGAGGGSGGGIRIESQGDMTVTGTLNAAGGRGGTAGIPDPALGSFDFAKGGGGGSGGRIKVRRNPCGNNLFTPLVSVSGGIGGAGYSVGSVGNSGTYSVTDLPPTTTGSIITWTGAISTDWFTACNWNTRTVPTSSDAVIVPQVTSGNYPYINGNAVCETIQVHATSGALVTVAIGSKLDITSP